MVSHAIFLGSRSEGMLDRHQGDIRLAIKQSFLDYPKQQAHVRKLKLERFFQTLELVECVVRLLRIKLCAGNNGKPAPNFRVSRV